MQMANKPTKICSTPLIIREKRIKTTIDNHFVSIRMAIISKLENSKCWQECEKLDFCALLLGM